LGDGIGKSPPEVANNGGVRRTESGDEDADVDVDDEVRAGSRKESGERGEKRDGV
jgi:hypothetical protein